MQNGVEQCCRRLSRSIRVRHITFNVPSFKWTAVPGRVRLRAPEGAQDMTLHAAAAKAARMRDL